MATNFKPNEAQRLIANALSRNASLLGRASTVGRLADGAKERFEQPRVGQLVAHVAAKQAEYGRALAAEFRAGRFSAATTLVRSLLEMSAWIAWPLSVGNQAKQRERLLRLVLQGYRNVQNQGYRLPPDAVQLLKEISGRPARNPPSFPQMLKDLDAHEAATDGKEFWRTHEGLFDYSSEHVHAGLHGPLFARDAGAPFELLGVSALTYGHQHLALSASSCAMLAGLDDLKRRVEARYAAVVKLQHREIERLTGSSPS